LYVNTGLGNAAVDPSENAGGDAWVSTIPVVAGQIYILYIDNFSSNGQAFNLTWQLTAGASLDCTVLPIELTSFQAEPQEQKVLVTWTTSSEEDNDRFEIERSFDGVEFTTIGMLPGAGSSSHELHYNWLDETPTQGLNHYRLRQVDMNGHAEHSHIATAFFKPDVQQVQLVPNPGSGLVNVLLQNPSLGSVLLVLDATGKEVQRVLLDGASSILNVTNLSHGLYGLRVLNASGQPTSFGTWVHE